MVLGQTGCGKTSFVQSLGKFKILGSNLLNVDWVSKTYLTKNREEEIRERWFSQSEWCRTDLLTETFQKENYDEDEKADSYSKIDGDGWNIFGENKKLDKLIVMDNVSGLADKSNDFASFLTVSRKFCYICLYIFHIIYPTKSIWQMILSQTKIFNIFPSTIHLSNILKILTNICDRDTINYTPARDLWIKRLYLSLSNESKYSCLTLDCRKSGLQSIG